MFATVYHEGNGLLVRPVVLKELGLREGQRITEAQMWKCIELNAAAFVGEMDARRERGEPNIPDTSKLERMLNEM